MGWHILHFGCTISYLDARIARGGGVGRRLDVFGHKLQPIYNNCSQHTAPSCIRHITGAICFCVFSGDPQDVVLLDRANGEYALEFVPTNIGTTHAPMHTCAQLCSLRLTALCCSNVVKPVQCCDAGGLQAEWVWLDICALCMHTCANIVVLTMCCCFLCVVFFQPQAV